MNEQQKCLTKCSTVNTIIVEKLNLKLYDK